MRERTRSKRWPGRFREQLNGISREVGSISLALAQWLAGHPPLTDSEKAHVERALRRLESSWCVLMAAADALDITDSQLRHQVYGSKDSLRIAADELMRYAGRGVPRCVLRLCDLDKQLLDAVLNWPMTPMGDSPRQENRLLERGAAEGFLSVYNRRFGTAFALKEDHSGAPEADFGCLDALSGIRMDVEVTQLQLEPGSLRHLLGMGRRERGSSKDEGPVSFACMARRSVTERLEEKVTRRQYRGHPALVMRQVEPIWAGDDWRALGMWDLWPARAESAYPAGIWVLCPSASGSRPHDIVALLGPRNWVDQEEYVLPDVLASGLKVVFCGMGAGHHAAAVGHYYAHPANRFWRTLHEVGLTPERLQPEEFWSVLRSGLGLTDIVQHQAGGDAQVQVTEEALQTLRRKVEFYRPRYLAFNGKSAARKCLGRRVDYGLQPERLGETLVFVLPSTSGANARYWDIGPWQELAHCVEDEW